MDSYASMFVEKVLITQEEPGKFAFETLFKASYENSRMKIFNPVLMSRREFLQ